MQGPIVVPSETSIPHKKVVYIEFFFTYLVEIVVHKKQIFFFIYFSKKKKQKFRKYFL